MKLINWIVFFIPNFVGLFTQNKKVRKIINGLNAPIALILSVIIVAAFVLVVFLGWIVFYLFGEFLCKFFKRK
jgi:hypothetical protein